MFVEPYLQRLLNAHVWDPHVSIVKPSRYVVFEMSVKVLRGILVTFVQKTMMVMIQVVGVGVVVTDRVLIVVVFSKCGN